MLSGLHQETHRVGIDSAGSSGVVRARIPDSVPLVQELLREHGYTTLGVTDGGNAGGAFGFSRGFDRFDDRGGGVDNVSRRAARFVSEADLGAPIFLFLHTYEAHSPYDPPPAQRELLGVPVATRDATSRFLLEHANTAHRTLSAAEIDDLSRLYDAEVRVVDDRLRGLWSELRAAGFLDRAVAIVTSDHGEELGEHGGLLHRDLLYDVLIKVPLLVVGAEVPAGRPLEPVSSVDIAPTLLALAGIPAPAALEGESLLDPARDLRRGRAVSQYGQSRYSLRTREWKLIWSQPGSLELFRMDADPGERSNVADRHPDVRDALAAALDRWRGRHRAAPNQGPPVELSGDQWRELESLGYLR
jgi:arylsulfatase A-like enzyme